MESELFYRIALTRVPGIGPILAKNLFRHIGEAAAIFRTPATTLGKITGIGKTRGWAIAGFKQFRSVEKEMVFLDKYKVRALFFTDRDYPQRLSNFADSPALLYFKGTADLNAARVVAMVGTRTPTLYGKLAIERTVGELSSPGLLLISGLAYGIDTLVHRAALHYQFPTVGVLGHGLDRIYPPQNTGLARQMVTEGGLLTEFGIDTEPDEHNFPVRNRIIAGMSDVVVVVESDRRGGSTLTVENALAYRRAVYAIPGRITDRKSAGTNALIREGKARMLTEGRQLIGEMNWVKQTAGEAAEVPAREQRGDMINAEPATLNAEPPSHRPDPRLSRLTPEERSILEFLHPGQRVNIDDLLRNEHLSKPSIPLALLNLEIGGLIRAFPGKFYCRI